MIALFLSLLSLSRLSPSLLFLFYFMFFSTFRGRMCYFSSGEENEKLEMRLDGRVGGGEK